MSTTRPGGTDPGCCTHNATTNDDTMGIKTEQRKFARAVGRDWEATALEELHGAQTPENSTAVRAQGDTRAQENPRRGGHGTSAAGSWALRAETGRKQAWLGWVTMAREQKRRAGHRAEAEQRCVRRSSTAMEMSTAAMESKAKSRDQRHMMAWIRLVELAGTSIRPR
jgi:hypothetical protein